MRKRLLMLVVLVATTVGCFDIQGKHTVYLEPDGTVTWTVLEEEIRHDGETPEARRRAADAFLDLVAANRHDAAVSLAALHPSSLNTRILREEAPQAILTEAHFPGIDRLHQNLFDLYRILATAELEIDEERGRLEIWVWPAPEDVEEPPDREELERMSAILLGLLAECRIILTEGKFVDAVGFEIEPDGKVAVPTGDDGGEEEDEEYMPVVLSLSWEREPEQSSGPGTAGSSEPL